MDTLESKTIRLSEGETEMLMRALVEATEQANVPRVGDTQMLMRQAQTSHPPENTGPIEQTNFIL